MSTLLICRKCIKRLGAEGKAVRKTVKHVIDGGRYHGAEMVKTDCFGLCPRDGVVLATSRRADDRRLVVVQPTSQLEDAAAYLLGITSAPE